MAETQNAAQQHQNLAAREHSLTAAKGRLMEQLEAVNSELASVRASLSGAELGFTIARQAAASASEGDIEPREE